MADNDKNICAEHLPYWRTSGSSPGVWLDRAADQIEKAGGTVYVRAEGRDPVRGCVAYLIEFELHGEHFRVTWPVVPSRSQDKTAPAAAKRQAATMLFHDIKGRCMSAQVLGARTAFFAFLVLPSNTTAAQAALPEVNDALQGFGPRALPEGKT